MKFPIHFRLFFFVLICSGALAAAAFRLTVIDTDITRYLPRHDPVIADAGYIFRHHPVQDQIVIDLELKGPKENPDRLSACADRAESLLTESGLFRRVGMRDMQMLFPDLISHILKNFPVLFSKKDLQDNIAPLLEKNEIRKRMENLFQSLQLPDSIGQANYIAADPLGFKDRVLARMADLAPAENIRIHKGKLISPDGKHLLIMAVPNASGTDTEFARRLQKFFKSLSRLLEKEYPGLVLTPVGAFRAALDNEMIVRQDVNRAVLLASAGISLLLLLAFPRPLMGLFAFLPALAGTAAAFFVMSLIYRSVSVMALGFGGAIISITVDHGIAYLLFLDRPEESSGRAAAAEIRAVGLIATLTTIGAFASLCFYDFPIFEQLGLFTALGIAFSFLFVHTVFPRIFPHMPPASPRKLPLRTLVEKLSGSGKKGASAALFFVIIMAFFAKPDFNVKLSAMNTVTRETAAAQDLLAKVWGQQIFSKSYLMCEEKTWADLQKKSDQVLEMLAEDMQSQFLSSAFLPSMIFPGEMRQKKNLGAWKEFWSPERIAELKMYLDDIAGKTGFTADAFAAFYRSLSAENISPGSPEIPASFFPLLGISHAAADKSSGNPGQWRQFSSLRPGPEYDAERFMTRYSSLCRIFDPGLFSHRMGKLLFSTFSRMLLLIAVSVGLLLFFFFLDLKLTAAALLPVCFAMICTLGSMKLTGRSLDIPGLMLSIIVFGMGIDYSLFIVRSYQRYRDEQHPAFALIRMAVFMASASTMAGFGVLCFAKHSLLQSAGLTSLLGIIYSLIGAFVLLPPLMRRLFREKPDENKGKNIGERLMYRYKNAEAYPRLFAYFKLRTDIMFSELEAFLKNSPSLRTVIDIGCGYGIPACWLLERFPKARVYGIDPDPERTRVAARAAGKRGEIRTGRAPHIPDIAEKADMVCMLDMIHFLNDEDLQESLEKIHACLGENGCLVLRAGIPPEDKKYSKMWRYEVLKMKIAGIPLYRRSGESVRKMIRHAGFRIAYSGLSGGNRESLWLICER